MQTKETITLTINVNIYNKMELIISNECIIDNVTRRLRFPLFRYMYEAMKRFVSSIEHVTCKRKVINNMPYRSYTCNAIIVAIFLILF